MSKLFNYLKLHRNRSPLTQSDIAYLAGTHFSNISRWEKRQREPNIEFLLLYHLLFDTSIESFFEPQLETVKSKLITQIRQLVDEIKKKDNIPRSNPIILFLEQALIRLTT